MVGAAGRQAARVGSKVQQSGGHDAGWMTATMGG